MAGANRFSAPQTGAQGSGIAVQGDKNTVQTGGNSLGTVTGNVNIQNGLKADEFSSLVGELFKASPAQVAQATPPAVTPAAAPTAETGAGSKKIVVLAIVAAAAIALGLIVRKFLKK